MATTPLPVEFGAESLGAMFSGVLRQQFYKEVDVITSPDFALSTNIGEADEVISQFEEIVTQQVGVLLSGKYYTFINWFAGLMHIRPHIIEDQINIYQNRLAGANVAVQQFLVVNLVVCRILEHLKREAELSILPPPLTTDSVWKSFQSELGLIRNLAFLSRLAEVVGNPRVATRAVAKAQQLVAELLIQI
jgi:hypothetical protein